MSGLPATTLYPLVFALASSIVIVLLIGLSMGVRQQSRRDQRRAIYQLAYEETLAFLKERAKPGMHEIISDGKDRRAGTGQMDSKKINVDMPISALILPHRPDARVLPSSAPPLLISVMILQPKPPTSDTPGANVDQDEDEESLGAEIELGTEMIDVVGDWRKVVKTASLGFE